MRKIETQEEIERRKKRNVSIMSFSLLMILVISTLGYSFMSSDKFNGANGSNDKTDNSGEQKMSPDGRWIINYNGREVLLISSPESIQDVIVDANFRIEDYYGEVVYIDSENAGIYSEIASNLAMQGLDVREACYEKCERDLPEKSCRDNIIVWRESEKNRVYQNESCAFIEGNMKAADAFLYKIFSVN